MYCRNCGRQIDENTVCCPYCRTDTTIGNAVDTNDGSNIWFAILGFFVPIVGLILYLVYEKERPKRARSAGKGALIGFITNILMSVLCVILAVTVFVMSVSVVKDSVSGYYDECINIPVLSEESGEDVVEKFADITFGEFTIKKDAYYDETSLDVTVKNISDRRYTFYITIEAVDQFGARLKTDTVIADRLNPGQSISLTAFEYAEYEETEELKNATFKVLDVQYYSY